MALSNMHNQIVELRVNLERAEQQRDELREALTKAPRWSIDKYDQRCLGCGVVAYFNDTPTRETVNHQPDCWVARADQALANLNKPES